MSHDATNWAIKIRGLSPAAKIVLWHLADRYHPDHGCFPTQATLAHDAEMSVSSLNNQLRTLEQAGLISREQRVDTRSGKQQSTYYILWMDGPKPLEPTPNIGDGQLSLDEGQTENTDSKNWSRETHPPTPNNGENRLQNLETNSVREPVKKKKKNAGEIEFSQTGWERLLRIAGYPEGAALPSWWQGGLATRHVAGWQDDYDFTEEDILAIAEDARKGRTEPLDGPKGLDQDMRREAISRQRQKAGKTHIASASGAPQMTNEQLLQFYADWVNSDKYIRENTLKTSMRAELIHRGLVTEERCKERRQA